MLVNLDGHRLLIKNDAGGIARLSFVGYGKGYRWLNRPKPEVKQTSNGADIHFGRTNDELLWDLSVVEKQGVIELMPKITAHKQMAIEYLGMEFDFDDSEQSSAAEFTDVNGKKTRVKIPLAIGMQSNIVAVSILDKQDTPLFTLNLKQPVNIHNDKTLRLKLIEKQIDARQSANNLLTFSFPEAAKFYADLDQYPGSSSHAGWYAFEPKSATGPGELGMSHWLELPTQVITSQGGKLLLNNKPFKVWGTNVEYSDTAPEKKDGAQRAAFFAKYGVNGVRLHKLTNPGWEGLGNRESAVEYEPEALDRFDYFTDQLRKNNITYGLSPIWFLKIFPGDRKKLVAYDELAEQGDTRGVLWFADDVQQLHIEAMLNLLNHKNPYSGLRYADDPAVTYFELQNEDDVFFFTTGRMVARAPTYEKMAAALFSDWLKAKYGSHDNLVKAWGKSAIDAFKGNGGLNNEQLDKRNILPVGNPWMWDNQIDHRRFGKRLQDTAEFLLETQNRYYAKAVAAIRKAGFKGEIVAGNWQAGGGPAHLLNLMSDASFGMIDRHNYMGGVSGPTQHKVEPGYTLKNDTMLPNAGSRILSTGMQQVKDKPFVLSEWLAVPPDEWAAADTTIIAAYGMGLQDWDMSYHFASNGYGFTDTLNYPQEKKFNNLTPVGFGLYPVLSRMVLRGDVAPGDVVAVRRATEQQALTGTYDFESTSVQTYDLKAFDGTPSQKALAVGQVLLEFGEQAKPSTILDWQKYRHGKTITSTTGELSWTEGDTDASGFIEINTAGTQGFAGFTGGKSLSFKNMTIKSEGNYSVVLTTAQSQDKTIANDDKVIIIAMSKAHNTGMTFDKDLVVSVGKGPTLLEPVKAGISFSRKPKRITVLDHDGFKTKTTYDVADGKFELDTGRDKSPYYLVEF